MDREQRRAIEMEVAKAARRSGMDLISIAASAEKDGIGFGDEQDILSTARKLIEAVEACQEQRYCIARSVPAIQTLEAAE